MRSAAASAEKQSERHTHKQTQAKRSDGATWPCKPHNPYTTTSFPLLAVPRPGRAEHQPTPQGRGREQARRTKMANSRKSPPPVLLVVAVAAVVFLCSCPAAVSARKVGETCALDRNCAAGLHCETCVADGNVRPRCTRVTPVDPQSKAADLPFNRYSWLTTHNSFARLGTRSQTGTAIATAWNQQDTVTQQLNNGVRGLMLDMYDFRNDIWLCHSYGGACRNFTAFTPAVNVLREIEVFLTRNPSEVITIFIEDYVESPKGLTRVFNASGLTPYLFPAWRMPKNGGDWPLLSDMVRDSHRLVVFTSKAAKEQAEGFAHEWRYVVENQYGTKGMVNGSCPKRAESAAMNDMSRSLVLVNYFRDLPNLPEACKDNSARLLGMLDTCHAASGDRWANFIAVDFYKRSDRGGAAEATDKANGGLVCGCGSIAACNSNGTCSAHKRGATPKGIFNATSDAAVWRPATMKRPLLMLPTTLIALLLWL